MSRLVLFHWTFLTRLHFISSPLIPWQLTPSLQTGWRGQEFRVSLKWIDWFIRSFVWAVPCWIGRAVFQEEGLKNMALPLKRTVSLKRNKRYKIILNIIYYYCSLDVNCSFIILIPFFSFPHSLPLYLQLFT